MEEIVRKIYKEQKKEQFIDGNIQLLNKNQLITVKDWKKLTEEAKERDGYPRGLRTILDEAAKGIQIF